MRDHFGEGERVQAEFPLPAGERFVEQVGEVERGTAGGDDLHVGQRIRDQLELESDVGDALRFVDDEQGFVAEDGFQARRSDVLEQGAHVRFVAVEPDGALVAAEQGAQQRGFPGLARAGQHDGLAAGEFLANRVREQTVYHGDSCIFVERNPQIL